MWLDAPRMNSDTSIKEAGHAGTMVRPRSLVSEVKGMARGGERAQLRGCGGTATCGCNTGAMAGLLGALQVGRGHFRWIFCLLGVP